VWPVHPSRFPLVSSSKECLSVYHVENYLFFQCKTVTSTEAAAAAEACAPMFVLLTGSQPVVISFVQQRALSHARTTPPPPASHPLGSPPPLAAHPSYHFATKPLAEQRQRQQNGVSFPFSVSFPVRPKLSPLPGVFPLGRRPWSLVPATESACQSKTESERPSRPSTDDRRPVAGSAVRPFWFMCVSFRRSILICECEPECAIVCVFGCLDVCVRIGYGSLEYLLPVNSVAPRPSLWASC